MSKMSKACDISERVRKTVYDRDSHKCIICGSRNGIPNAHYLRRSQGGLGVEQNIVTLCQECHHEFDNGKQGENYKTAIKAYLMAHYDDWNEKNLVYDKWKEFEIK